MTAIVFKGVHKSYGDHPPVLREVDLEIRDGEFCVFIGPSGCGKSTLLRSLAGEQAVLGGTLRRGRTVLVRQDAVPLPGPVLATLRRVAAAHGAACSATDIRSFAERLGLAVPLAALPAGWDTVCEPGVALPPGCDQALCLLAAALARPDLLLLDEATAMFDQATAATIVAGLATLPGAIIASAHRGGAYTGWPRLDLAQPIARIELPTSACIATMLVPMKATMAGMPA
ncbi:MAG TPA: hypothetical protein DCS97_04325 [Planctomycetes bacterium]|nr:hypothetical protein [Planctomycetota bacterium]